MIDLKTKLIQDYEDIGEAENHHFAKTYIGKLFYDLYGLNITEFTKQDHAEE